jgi:hypothetical protein
MAITLLGRFLIGLALAALAIALAALLPQQAGTVQAVLRLVVLALILIGLWPRISRRGWLLVAVTLVAWQALVWWLAQRGTFAPTSPLARALPVAFLLPLLIGLPLLLRSRSIGAVLDATPAGWLIGLQVYRVFGSVFLVGWANGAFPSAFALPAGFGDVLTGLLALPVAALVQAEARGWRTAAIAWNVFGILDLVNALTLGSLTSVGVIPVDHPTTIGLYPVVLIPAFAVPLSLLLHALSLRQIRRRSAQPEPRPAVRGLVPAEA